MAFKHRAAHTAAAHRTGHKLSAATRAKISKALKGKKHPHKASSKPRKPMSAATKAKISAALKGKHHPHKASSKPRKPVSAATKAKLSAALKGKKHPHKGHPLSADAKAKISAALKGKHRPGGHPARHRHPSKTRHPKKSGHPSKSTHPKVKGHGRAQAHRGAYASMRKGRTGRFWHRPTRHGVLFHAHVIGTHNHHPLAPTAHRVMAEPQRAAGSLIKGFHHASAVEHTAWRTQTPTVHTVGLRAQGDRRRRR